MNLSVKKYAYDKKTFYYAKEVIIGNKTLKTPITTLHPEQRLQDLPLKSENKITEIWKTLDYNNIKDATSNNEIAIKLSQDISLKGSVHKDILKAYFVNIKNIPDNPFKNLNTALITKIVDDTHRFTDMVIFPTFKGTNNIINNESILIDFTNFIETCYEIMETLNNKPIMAMIPPIPINYISQITRKYLDLGIKCFCFDFVGSGLNSYYSHYKAFLRELYNYDRKSIGEILKYSLNLRMPSNYNPNGPYPAEDLLAPAIGVDILGINHIGGGSTKNEPSTTRKPKNKKQEKINLIDTEIYAYRRIASPIEFTDYFPKTIFPIDYNIINASNKEKSLFRRNFNYTEKTIELDAIHKKIMNNESIYQALRNKKGLDDARKSIIGNITTIMNPIDSYFQ